MRCDDGSAGMISWGIRQRDRHCFTPQPVRIVADPDYTAAFTVEDSGTRLLLEARAKPHLLNLPHALRARIFELVVSPVEGTHVNLDKDTKVSCGLIHVNRHLYHGCRDQFLYQNKFVLSMTTNQARTTLDNFEVLQGFLRKTFDPLSTSFVGENTIAGGNSRYKELGPDYMLKFELESAVPLSDIRINALPFVMETAATKADQKITIQTWVRGSQVSLLMVSSHTLTLLELRINVVTAMMSHVFLNQNTQLPDFWVNGLGQVVDITEPSEDSGGAWDMASDVVTDSAGFVHILNLHPIDFNYRREYKSHPDCNHWSDEIFFPFHRNAQEILTFLMRGLDNGTRPNFRMFSGYVMRSFLEV
jgi:hypothetical protein